jgi:hypothetical protein
VDIPIRPVESNAMSNRSGKLLKNPRALAVHEGGHADFIEANCSRQKLRWEELKLSGRLGRFCKARGFIGDLRVFFRRRKLLARLRRRFELPHALFLAGRHGKGADNPD